MTASFTSTWSARNFGPITGSGARKLADSKVAPLVALARGYYSVADKTQTKALAERATAAASTISLTRQLNTLVAGDEDILVMPWFALSQVSAEGIATRSYNTQYRPSKPIRDAQGKTVKYAWFAGERLVIDLHPSTPLEWLDSSLDVVITEGVLKGDSALTSMLLAAGITVEMLSETPSPEDARARLAELMSAVPRSLRAPIINSASVTTWEDQADQWRHIRLTDKRVIIAFDGDLADNRMVWKQTRRAMKFVDDRKGQPEVLSMYSPEVELAQVAAGMDPADKLGIDDYLSKVGDWPSLLSLSTDLLPPEPDAAQHLAAVGEYRIHPENAARLQKYIQDVESPNGSGSAKWVDIARVGGRVVSTSAVREPTWDEIAAGAIDPDLDGTGTTDDTVIEVAVLDPSQDFDQEPVIHVVAGNASLLMSSSQGWVRALERGEARIPGELLRHPQFPLSGRDWEGWLSAIKRRGAEMDSVDQRRRWPVSGWVPGGAFIVGKQVIAASEIEAAAVVPGVTERNRKGITRFGVIDEPRDDLAAYKVQVLADVKTAVSVYLGLADDKSLGALAFFAAYRPTLPLRTHTSIAVDGPQGSGKSFFASKILAPWHSRPSEDWTRLILGTAADTRPETEAALAQTLIWVGDDLAPSTERGKAESQEAAISDIIRAVRNGATRNRKGEPILESRALFITTAENALSIPSIRSRAWGVRTRLGMYNEEGLQAFNEALTSGALGRLASAMIRLWQTNYIAATWAQQIIEVEHTREYEKHEFEQGLIDAGNTASGAVTRQAENAADLAVVGFALYFLILWASEGRDEKEVLRELGLNGFYDGRSKPGSYQNLLFSRLGEQLAEQKTSTPGHAIVEATARVLSMGAAHLTNPVSPGLPPSADPATLVALGWQLRGTDWVPQGSRIGFFGIHTPSRGAARAEAAIIDAQTAWAVVQRSLPGAILHGTKSAEAWRSAAQSGLLITPSTATAAVTKTRIRSAGKDADKQSQRHSGVPILWTVLSGGGTAS